MSEIPANYQEINRASWNNRLQAHLESEFYDMKGFMSGKSSLNSIELDLLGDVKGKSILHLQCHFGQDSISLSRMGAQVTGVDLSDQAIEKGREIAAKLGTDTRFVCCDLYDLSQHLDETFDIVFTSYGTISWMPDLDKWAGVISTFLKPGGSFVFAEFHPVVWAFDDDLQKINYHYFNVEAIAEEESGTYADRESSIKQKYVCWNHGLGEVHQSLQDQGLSVLHLKEYDYAPYDFISSMEEFAPGKYRVKQWGNKLPLVYSIVAQKP